MPLFGRRRRSGESDAVPAHASLYRVRNKLIIGSLDRVEGRSWVSTDRVITLRGILGRKGDLLSFVPTRNAGPTGPVRGFQHDPSGALYSPATPEEAGTAALAALDRAVPFGR